MMSALLLSFGLSQNMWGEVVLTSNYILNKVPQKMEGNTPYEIWKRRKPFLVYESKILDKHKNEKMESRNASFVRHVFSCKSKERPSSSK